RQLALARVVALLRRAPDLAFDAPLLELQDAHAEHRLVALGLAAGDVDDLADEPAETRLVLGQPGERVVEVRDEVLARTAGCVGRKLVIRRQGKVPTADLSAREAARQKLAL